MARRLQTHERVMTINDYLPGVSPETKLEQLTEDQVDALQAWVVHVQGWSAVGLRARLDVNKEWGMKLGEYVSREQSRE